MAESKRTKGRKMKEAFALVAYDPDYGRIMQCIICPASDEDGMWEEDEMMVFAYIDDEILATGDYAKILKAVVEVTGISLIPVEEEMANPNVKK
jgi:hypothetical protein